jgi:hypothetical protein
MKGKIVFLSILAIFLALAIVQPAVAQTAKDYGYADPKTYTPSHEAYRKEKAFYDDPRPSFKTLGPAVLVPKEMYADITGDPEEAKKLWTEVVGFKAPDVVGKVCPEIKPGKYTYKDVQGNECFKKLLPPSLYARIHKEGPPIANAIEEFEIIPTRQYYKHKRVTEATKKNEGKTKLDDKGYLIHTTWAGGYPFPRPSGNFKAQQVMYNVEKRSLAWEQNFYIAGRLIGINKDLKVDSEQEYEVKSARFTGRTLMRPFGYLDKRAEERQEFKSFAFGFQSPRDSAGVLQVALFYSDVSKPDSLLLYIPAMRRVRKMTSSDTQDQVMGIDQTYDDNEGWMQKLSSTVYPYSFKVLEEGEYLVMAPTVDGSEYINKHGTAKNAKFERRPCYVIEMTQLDKSYVYSKRTFWVDKETFQWFIHETLDRKGRLFRTFHPVYGWHPETGVFSWMGYLCLNTDWVDNHVTWVTGVEHPAWWGRMDLNMGTIVKK